MSKLSLASTHPELAEQADGWDPNDPSIPISKNLDWTCKLGHNWQARISKRVTGQGCPYCSNHRLLVGFNDLATTHPEVAKEADGWDPTQLISDGHRNYPWKCRLGHTWVNSISNRKGGQGCPYCKGKKVLAGFNDLLSLHPEIAQQAFGWDPSQYSIGSGKKLSWRCLQGHVWDSTIATRVSQQTNCPVCSNKKVLVGYNDLATTHPELAELAYGWDPKSLTAGSGKKVRWKCTAGHITEAVVESRAKNKTQCSFCINKKIQSGFNDIASQNPELASEAYGWDPSTLSLGSNKKVMWICKKKHTWETSPSTRSSGLGCPYCANFYVWPGENDLATTHPELAQQADGWDPQHVGSGSGKVLAWKCNLGHTWKGRVIHRARRNVGCPYCANNKVLPGFNDLETTHPELAKQANGWDPTSITAGHNSKKNWICALGHTWDSMVNSRSYGDLGCPYCVGSLAWPGFNDLKTINPRLASEAYGWDPSTVTVSANKKVMWKCSEGHTWKTEVAHRSAGRGCPTCAKTGFDPNKDGYFYFLNHPDWDMYQVGITNVPDQRIGKHRSLGWELIELRGPVEGQVARDLETDVLRMLKARGAKLSPSEIAGRFDGMTESWLKGSVRDFSSIRELEGEVRLLAEEPKIDKRSAEYRRGLKDKG